MSLRNTSEEAIVNNRLSLAKKYQDEPLSECVKTALDNYFSHLNGHAANDLYRMVIDEVERPMFESVLKYTGGNQSRASSLLGISRSTLRKKLAHYGID